MRVLMTAGPTREHLDDVRFLSNPATGAMGVALAQACLARGWRVTVVSGPGEQRYPDAARVVRVTSAEEMFHAVQDDFPSCDLFIAAAAVSDYRPVRRMAGKFKKQEGNITVELERTPDVLAWAGSHRSEAQILVGFALESDPDVQLARDKLVRKRCDLLVHNGPGNFGTGGGMVRLISAQGVLTEGELNKSATAAIIVDAAEALQQRKLLVPIRRWPDDPEP